MNRMLLTAALGLSMAATAAVAQQTDQAPPAGQQQQTDHPRHHNPKKEAARMSKQLGLSEDQTAKLEPILADRQQKLDAVDADTTLTPDQKKQQARSIFKDSRQQIATILTPDQLAKLKQHHHGHQQDAPATQAPSQPQGL